MSTDAFVRGLWQQQQGALPQDFHTPLMTPQQTLEQQAAAALQQTQESLVADHQAELDRQRKLAYERQVALDAADKMMFENRRAEYRQEQLQKVLKDEPERALGPVLEVPMPKFEQDKLLKQEGFKTYQKRPDWYKPGQTKPNWKMSIPLTGDQRLAAAIRATTKRINESGIDRVENQLGRFAKDTFDIGGFYGAYKTRQLKKSWERIQNGEGSTEDIKLIGRYLALEKAHGKDGWFHNVLETLGMSAKFMGEFALTELGIGALGLTGRAAEGANAISKLGRLGEAGAEVLGKAIPTAAKERMAASVLGRTLAKGMQAGVEASVSGGATMLSPAFAGEIGQSILQRRLPHIEQTAVGPKVMGPGETMGQSVVRGAINQWVEQTSEMLGEPLMKALGIAAKPLKEGGKAALRLARKVAPDAVTKVSEKAAQKLVRNQFVGRLKALYEALPGRQLSTALQKHAKWDGVVGEILEERAGELMKGALQIGQGGVFPDLYEAAHLWTLGEQDKAKQKLFDALWQQSIEGASFAIPGLMGHAAGKAFGKVQEGRQRKQQYEEAKAVHEHRQQTDHVRESTHSPQGAADWMNYKRETNPGDLGSLAASAAKGGGTPSRSAWARFGPGYRASKAQRKEFMSWINDRFDESGRFTEARHLERQRWDIQSRWAEMEEARKQHAEAWRTYMSGDDAALERIPESMRPAATGLRKRIEAFEKINNPTKSQKKALASLKRQSRDFQKETPEQRALRAEFDRLTDTISWLRNPANTENARAHWRTNQKQQQQQQTPEQPATEETTNAKQNQKATPGNGGGLQGQEHAGDTEEGGMRVPRGGHSEERGKKQQPQAEETKQTVTQGQQNSPVPGGQSRSSSQGETPPPSTAPSFQETPTSRKHKQTELDDVEAQIDSLLEYNPDSPELQPLIERRDTIRDELKAPPAPQMSEGRKVANLSQKRPGYVEQKLPDGSSIYVPEDLADRKPADIEKIYKAEVPNAESVPPGKTTMLAEIVKARESGSQQRENTTAAAEPQSQKEKPAREKARAQQETGQTEQAQRPESAAPKETASQAKEKNEGAPTKRHPASVFAPIHQAWVGRYNEPEAKLLMPHEVDVPKALKKFLDRVPGLKYAFVRSPGKVRPGGMALGDVALFNERILDRSEETGVPEQIMWGVVGHEVAHAASLDERNLFTPEELVAGFEEYLSTVTDETRAALGQMEKSDPFQFESIKRREGTAYLVGTFMRDSAFRKQLFADDIGRWRKIVNAIEEALRRIPVVAQMLGPHQSTALKAMRDTIEKNKDKFPDESTETPNLVAHPDKQGRVIREPQTPTDKILAAAGLNVSRVFDGWYVGGNTYAIHQLFQRYSDDLTNGFRDLGGQFNGNGWKFEYDPASAIAEQLRAIGFTEGLAQQSQFTAAEREDMVRNSQREREHRRLPDARRDGSEYAALVDPSTRDLIARGLEHNIAQETVDEQIEDIGRIIDAHEKDKPLFLLASAPGMGKTFVLAGAIRELRRKGANKFLYVTVNRDLIEQIKKDVGDYGLEGVEFATYPDIRRKKYDTTGTVLILDEAHAIKNVGLQTGAKGAALVAKADYTILSSATPFENVAEAKYLDGSGIFDDVRAFVPRLPKAAEVESRREPTRKEAPGVRKHYEMIEVKGYPAWAWMHGAGLSFSGKNREHVKVIWNRLDTREEMQKQANVWFQKQGMYTQRATRFKQGMVRSLIPGTDVAEEHVRMFDDVLHVYAEAEERLAAGPDAAWVSHVRAHAINTQKRLLEVAKIDAAIDRAKQLVSENKQPVIFINYKAPLVLGRFQRNSTYLKKNNIKGKEAARLFTYPEMLEAMEAWKLEAAAARRMKEKPPQAPFTPAMMAIAASYHAHDIDVAYPSVVDKIRSALGKSNIAEYTGAVSEKKAREQLNEWKWGLRMTLVATIDKGGTGLSLHDTTGAQRRRVMIIVSLPWSGTKVEQASGRLARQGIKKPVEMEWLAANNIPFDQELSKIVGSRMLSLNALVKRVNHVMGQAIKEFDVGAEEGEVKPEEPKNTAQQYDYDTQPQHIGMRSMKYLEERLNAIPRMKKGEVEANLAFFRAHAKYLGLHPDEYVRKYWADVLYFESEKDIPTAAEVEAQFHAEQKATEEIGHDAADTEDEVRLAQSAEAEDFWAWGATSARVGPSGRGYARATKDLVSIFDTPATAGQQFTKPSTIIAWLAANKIKWSDTWIASKNYSHLMRGDAFRQLNIFDRARVMAFLERKTRGKPYATGERVHTNTKTGKKIPLRQSGKLKQSKIFVADPIKGCDIMCPNCYSAVNTSRSDITHYQVQRTHIGGLLPSGHLLRVGENGDPSSNWSHCAQEVKGVIERSRQAGNDVGFHDVYAITKLLSIDDFDASVFPNVEVTLDPLNPSHMKQSAINLLKVKAAHPDVNIVVRIRSMWSNNADFNLQMQWAVDFANRFGLQVIETGMRWKNKEYFDALDLRKDKYDHHDMWFHPVKPLLREKAERWMLCGDRGGKCFLCKNRNRSMRVNRDENIQRFTTAMKREGVTPSKLPWARRTLVLIDKSAPARYQRQFQIDQLKRAKRTRGMLQTLRDGRSVMILTKARNSSTILHELAHMVLNHLQGVERTAIHEWLGVNDDRPTREQHERFARAFERYVYDGFPPSLALEEPMQKVSKWMHSIYREIASSPIAASIPSEIAHEIDTVLGSPGGIKEDIKRAIAVIDKTYRLDKWKKPKRKKNSRGRVIDPAKFGSRANMELYAAMQSHKGRKALLAKLEEYNKQDRTLSKARKQDIRQSQEQRALDDLANGHITRDVLIYAPVEQLPYPVWHQLARSVQTMLGVPDGFANKPGLEMTKQYEKFLARKSVPVTVRESIVAYALGEKKSYINKNDQWDQPIEFDSYNPMIGTLVLGPEARIKMLADVGRMLMTKLETGDAGEYRDLEETIAPLWFDVMGEARRRYNNPLMDDWDAYQVLAEWLGVKATPTESEEAEDAADIAQVPYELNTVEHYEPQYTELSPELEDEVLADDGWDDWQETPAYQEKFESTPKAEVEDEPFELQPTKEPPPKVDYGKGPEVQKKFLSTGGPGNLAGQQDLFDFEGLPQKEEQGQPFDPDRLKQEDFGDEDELRTQVSAMEDILPDLDHVAGQMQEAMSVPQLSFSQKLASYWDTLKQGLRVHRYIPNSPRFDAYREHFRLFDEKVPKKSQRMSLEMLSKIMAPLTDKKDDRTPTERSRDMSLFTFIIYMRDAIRSIEQGNEGARFGWDLDENGEALPMETTLERMKSYLSSLEDKAKGRPPVVEALRRRQNLVRPLVHELIRRGILPPEAARNPNTYYHRVVMDYWWASLGTQMPVTSGVAHQKAIRIMSASNRDERLAALGPGQWQEWGFKEAPKTMAGKRKALQRYIDKQYTVAKERTGKQKGGSTGSLLGAKEFGMQAVRQSFQKARLQGYESLPEQYNFSLSFADAEMAWLHQAFAAMNIEDWQRELANIDGDLFTYYNETAKRQNYLTWIGGEAMEREIQYVSSLINEPAATNTMLSESAATWRRWGAKKFPRSVKQGKEILREYRRGIDPSMPFRVNKGYILRRLADLTGLDWLGQSGSTDKQTFLGTMQQLQHSQDHNIARLANAFFAVNAAQEKQMKSDIEGMGKEYITVRSMVKKGWAVWYPKYGSAYFSKYTIGDHLVQMMMDGVVDNVTINMDDLHKVLAVAPRTRFMILPIEVVKQLDHLEDQARKQRSKSWLAKHYAHAYGFWKEYALHSPAGLPAYTARQVLGDLDAAIAVGPGMLPRVGKSAAELFRYFSATMDKRTPSESLQTAIDLGVIDSGYTRHDLPTADQFEEMTSLLKRPDKIARRLWHGYWRKMGKFSQFRESILRYAAYQYYLDKIRNGTLSNYGGAPEHMVKAIIETFGEETAAAHMSRRALGDYGNITTMGRFLARHIFPFWRFSEINLRRYPRIALNAMATASRVDGNVLQKAALGGIAVAQPFLLWAMLELFNWFRCPDCEKDLSNEELMRAHLTGGRLADGTILRLDNVGALSEFLEWPGLQILAQRAPGLARGQYSVPEVAWEMAQAPLDKIVNMAGPDIDVAYTMLTGTSTYPSVLHRREVDRMEELFGSYRFKDTYKELHGRLTGSGKRARPGTIPSVLMRATGKSTYGKPYTLFPYRLIGIADPKRYALFETYELVGQFTGAKVPAVREMANPYVKAMRDAAEIEDQGAFNDAFRSYIDQKLKDKRKTGIGDVYGSFLGVIGHLDPVGSKMGKEPREKFYAWLSEPQRERVQVARDHARNLEIEMWAMAQKATETVLSDQEREEFEGKWTTTVINKLEPLSTPKPMALTRAQRADGKTIADVRKRWEERRNASLDYLQRRGVDPTKALVEYRKYVVRHFTGPKTRARKIYLVKKALSELGSNSP